MKQILTITAIILIICLSDNCSDNPQVNNKYKYGDTILPDYALPDTLIVVNSEKLNEDMQLIDKGIIEPTDGNIATIFYNNCKIK